MRRFAYRLVTSTSLDTKLAPPKAADWDNSDPGPSLRIEKPGRPSNLAIASGREVKVPPIDGMRDPSQRARILHALANHELQAAELFAWALLAFADAPTDFRRGLLGILVDEQRHLAMYLQRLLDLGCHFGDYKVTGHFWNKVGTMRTPLDFVCTMGLTFENANLDFAKEYETAAKASGDHATAATLRNVHEDEVRHVGFAWHWLTRLKSPQQTELQAYHTSVCPPLGLGRARGKVLDRTSRVRAGLGAEFIAELSRAAAKRPSGAPR